MARETKVGLVAGLAFIVCFAVILSNRGATDPAEPYLSLLSGRAAGQRPVRTGLAAQPGAVDPGRTRTDGAVRGADAVPTRFEEAGPTAKPVGDEHRPPAAAGPAPSGAGSPLDEAGDVALGARRAGPVSRDGAALRAITDPARPAAIRPQSFPAGHSPARTTDARTRSMEDPRVGSRADGGVPSGGGPGAGSVPDGSALRTTHEPARYSVKPGDTLYGIAEEQFGKASGRLIDTILDLNRGQITDADHIRVGMVLLLPHAAATDGATRAARTAHTAAPATPDVAGRSGASESFRWYQVRKNDRYITIAREQLGDPKRWREIFELNREKFPDPDRIREGVRIKIPPA